MFNLFDCRIFDPQRPAEFYLACSYVYVLVSALMAWHRPTLTFSLQLSNFKTKAVFGFLDKNQKGHFFVFSKSLIMSSYGQKWYFLAILAKKCLFSNSSDTLANSNLMSVQLVHAYTYDFMRIFRNLLFPLVFACTQYFDRHRSKSIFEQKHSSWASSKTNLL